MSHASSTSCGCQPDPATGLLYVVHGRRGRILYVYEDRCIIRTKITFFSLLTHTWANGCKTIYYSDVIGVQTRPVGSITLGYFQLETASSLTSHGHGLFFNENTFLFNCHQEQTMRAVAQYIEGRIREIKHKQMAAVGVVCQPVGFTASWDCARGVKVQAPTEQSAPAYAPVPEDDHPQDDPSLPDGTLTLQFLQPEKKYDVFFAGDEYRVENEKVAEFPVEKSAYLTVKAKGYSASKQLWVEKGKATVVRIYLYDTNTALEVISAKKI